MIIGICSKHTNTPKKLVPGGIQAEPICLPLTVVMGDAFITPLYLGLVAEDRIHSGYFKQKRIYYVLLGGWQKYLEGRLKAEILGATLRTTEQNSPSEGASAMPERKLRKQEAAITSPGSRTTLPLT